MVLVISRFVLFFKTGFPCVTLGCPGTHFVEQAGPELRDLPAPVLECWDQRLHSSGTQERLREEKHWFELDWSGNVPVRTLLIQSPKNGQNWAQGSLKVGCYSLREQDCPRRLIEV